MRICQLERSVRRTNVRLGEYNTGNEISERDCVRTAGGGWDCTDPPLVIPIEQFIVHEGYRPWDPNKRNDIALLRLKYTAPYTCRNRSQTAAASASKKRVTSKRMPLQSGWPITGGRVLSGGRSCRDFIRPICLPSTDVTQDPPEDIALYAAGWGALNITTVHSDIKQHTSLPFTNFTECQSIYLRKYKHVELWNKQLCVGGRDGRDTCRKDSGGPLMYENGRVYEVVAVVSFGPSTCGGAAVAPGVYTKVHEYNAWIRSHIRP
ncbi:Phenoloxidase-activating enzyme [Eumeta japonica]|uniref:Phenoloxidase-activating enzyme n=1 Tax=Eumeta variegata TaxID=151549 RepID=A0A4C1WL34_EUMVA|nr:Phenoloxidase-activating enzyme [Eumeta japonica]